MSSVGNQVEQLELSYLFMGVKLGLNTFKKCVAVSTKAKHDLLLKHYDQEIPILNM